MLIHLIFDLLAWGSAALLFILLGRWKKDIFPPQTAIPIYPWYFAALSVGAICGAFFLGSLNLILSHQPAMGRSILGSIIGAIIAVEILKVITKTNRSTGLRFAAPAALGIAIGRIGCFISGIDDFTYGTPTTLPWGHDFGDGIYRHPVQLYEALALIIFLLFFIYGLKNSKIFVIRYGFYIFTGWYAVQRFVWEFLKPYQPVILKFNIFHVACIVLLIYSLAMILKARKSYARS